MGHDITRKSADVVDNHDMACRITIFPKEAKKRLNGGAVDHPARYALVAEDLDHLVAAMPGVFAAARFLRPETVALRDLCCARNAAVDYGFVAGLGVCHAHGLLLSQAVALSPLRQRSGRNFVLVLIVGHILPHWNRSWNHNVTVCRAGQPGGFRRLCRQSTPRSSKAREQIPPPARLSCRTQQENGGSVRYRVSWAARSYFPEHDAISSYVNWVDDSIQ